MIALLGATSCEKGHDNPPAVETQIAAFDVALDSFQIDCKRYPTTSEGLGALTTRPSEIAQSHWHGPYLDSPVPKDPWGHVYVYRCPGVHNTNSFDLYSCGPDGVSKSGGDDPDDIANWRRGKTGR